MHNDTIAGMNRLQLAWRTIWNSQSYRDVRALIRRQRPDVMHCTNIFPLISPSVYYAARAEGVPVVQSLHNFRLLCANAMLRLEGPDGKPCPGGGFFRCLRHGCYRHDRLATFVVLSMMRCHRFLRTWTPEGRSLHCPHAVRPRTVRRPRPAGRKSDSEAELRRHRSGPRPRQRRLCRLRRPAARGKRASRPCSTPGSSTTLPLPLKIIGDGPMAPDVQAAAGRQQYRMARPPAAGRGPRDRGRSPMPRSFLRSGTRPSAARSSRPLPPARP